METRGMLLGLISHVDVKPNWDCHMPSHNEELGRAQRGQYHCHAMMWGQGCHSLVPTESRADRISCRPSLVPTESRADQVSMNVAYFRLLIFQLAIFQAQLWMENVAFIFKPHWTMPRRGKFRIASVALDYSEKKPRSALVYLPAAVQGFCHYFCHW